MPFFSGSLLSESHLRVCRTEKSYFKASGLAGCHPEEGTFDFDFYISDEKCKIEKLRIQDIDHCSVRSCEFRTTYLVLENQIFYGPYLKHTVVYP